MGEGFRGYSPGVGASNDDPTNFDPSAKSNCLTSKNPVPRPTMNATQLELIADELEEASALTTPANENEAGRWYRIALAAEDLAGASTTASQSLLGYMLRAAVALEAVAGTSGAEENHNYSGYLKRIVDALEVKAGATGSGSLEHRAATAAAAAVWSSPLTLGGEALTLGGAQLEMA